MMFFVGLIVAFLSSCSTQSATSDDAPRASAGEETTSAEEALTGGEITAEPTTSTTVVDSPEFSQNTSASPAVGTYGMVSSANPLATQAGWKILAEGGNAFDAAVAVAAALGVVEPMMSGVGGYGAIVVYDAEEGETQFLDSGSRTPAALDPDVFRPPTPNYVENRCGAKAVTTPGNVGAWETLSGDYGNLEWGRLFDPAIELADEGFVLGDITAGWIDASFPYFPEHAQSIYGNNGVPLRAGERLVQKDLARSLDVIAEQGAGAMHEGELGQAVAATMRENDGFLTLEDLRNNRAEWRNTISIDHRGYEVVTASPPVSSWGILLRLGIMGQFNLQAPDHNSVTYLHTFTEASKQAGQASQGYAVDPESGRTPLDLLLSEGFWAEQAARINPSQAAPNLPPTPFAPTSCPPQSYSLTGSTNPQGTPNEPQQHTTHFVVADREGNVVSATQTLGNIFGSKVMPEGTGIWLNDSIAWSRFEPAGNPFDAFPGRLRRAGVSPTLVMNDGRPWVAIGTPGGRTIVQTTPQMLMNLIDFNMDIQQAIAAPRVSSMFPDLLVVETGVPQSVRNELSALGHNVEINERGLGNAHGLTVEYDSDGRPTRFTGGADPRGRGAAIGY